MARGMAERCWETGVVPCVFTGGGSAVRAGDGGKGEIPSLDAHAGQFHGVSGAFLLPDGQPLPYPAGGSADGGKRAFR